MKITIFGDVLGIVFIVLKLCGVIDWSWWWVLAPIWGPLAFWLILWAIFTILLYFETPQQRAVRELEDMQKFLRKRPWR